MAITSAIKNSGHNIYHKQYWQQHQPIKIKMATKSAIVIQGNNICQSPLAMVININHHTKVDKTQKTSSLIIWLNNKKFKIIYNNFPHTPSKVGVIEGKHFPLHWMKPCQLDWRKLVL